MPVHRYTKVRFYARTPCTYGLYLLVVYVCVRNKETMHMSVIAVIRSRNSIVRQSLAPKLCCAAPEWTSQQELASSRHRMLRICVQRNNYTTTVLTYPVRTVCAHKDVRPPCHPIAMLLSMAGSCQQVINMKLFFFRKISTWIHNT